MLEIKKDIGEGFSGQPGGLFDILTQLQNIGAGNQGTVYFVDSAKGSNGYDGLSWKKAFKEIAYAISVNNAKRSGGERGTIFIRGDFTETLSVAPSKCDLIGVGSNNARSRPRITGTQVMVDTAWGTRFINLEFRADATSAVMTFTAGGFEIHNCVFSHYHNATATDALVIANPTDVLIKGCKFEQRNELFFSTCAITLTSTTMIKDCQIIDCHIRGAVGVTISFGSSDNWYSCLMKDCYIFSSGLCVNDVSEMWELINNRFVTRAANSADDMLVYGDHLAAGNICTGTTNTVTAPTLSDLITYT